ncbi:hypothetical protein [Antarcticimicrobium luteum]|uniref:Sulfotransferase family protein n=1 Tax=Antarcticimicrobium luteum TaxID=2547397 RepID=A0A4V3ARI6_9RHOB|nr:hypothetical protein [Antarcticimicrobium luteum]TDK46787.1 hypothetical protein E1832_11860 [Antarcticimicrobium luteum]
MRVILHAGFHKTGTTTLQQALHRNRRTLDAHLRLVPRDRMMPAGRSARAWSASRDPLDMALFRYELAEVMVDWDSADPRPLVTSVEDLCGNMPGRHGVESYAAAAPLMIAILEVLSELHPAARPEFYFSTRAPQAWLASVHAQHLRAMRMTESAEDFAERYRRAADLDAVVDDISAALAPLPVHRAALEQSAGRPLGPLAPLLDLLGLPAALLEGLVPHPPANTAPPPDCAAAFLRLNRSDLGEAELRAAKQALLREAG